MEFKEYASLALWFDNINPEEHEVVVRLGLIGEAGELCEKIKKWMRLPPEKRGDMPSEDILKESGDVLWYLAVCLSKYWPGLDLGRLTSAVDHPIADNIGVLALEVGCWAAEIASSATFYTHGRMLDGSCELLARLDKVLKKTGKTLQDAMCANLDKLEDRHHRGTLMGSGDNR